MKRVFTFLMIAGVVLGTSQPLLAQEGKWSLKGGVGWYSVPDIVGALIVGFGSIDTTEGTSSDSFVTLLNPNVTLLYSHNDWLSIGGSLTLGYASAKSTFDNNGALNKSIKALYPSLCLGAQTRYFSAGKFSMYGSWGVGVMGLYSDQFFEGENTTQFAATLMGNVYPLCFSCGGKVGGFLELGWGANGLANAGIYCTF